MDDSPPSLFPPPNPLPPLLPSPPCYLFLLPSVILVAINSLVRDSTILLLELVRLCSSAFFLLLSERILLSVPNNVMVFVYLFFQIDM